ncbi:hypothetical protein [Streptomyces sp. NPDC001889]
MATDSPEQPVADRLTEALHLLDLGVRYLSFAAGEVAADDQERAVRMMTQAETLGDIIKRIPT